MIKESNYHFPEILLSYRGLFQAQHGWLTNLQLSKINQISIFMVMVLFLDDRAQFTPMPTVCGCVCFLLLLTKWGRVPCLLGGAILQLQRTV